MSNTAERLSLDYMHGGAVVYQPGESLMPRRLDDQELVYVISGNVTYVYEGLASQVGPGSIIFGQPGGEEEYRWDPAAETRHAYFHFKISALPNDWPALDQWPRVWHKPSTLSVELFRHVLHGIYERAGGPLAAPDARDCLYLEMLLDSLRSEADWEGRGFERDRPDPVRRALKWMLHQIEDHPEQAFGLQELAAAAGCSPKYLCRVFKSSVGHSPMQTGTLMRLRLSLTLLTRTNLPINQVARRCGFENALYFSRVFSKTFGRPPSEIRAGLARGVPPPTTPLPIDVTPRARW